MKEARIARIRRMESGYNKVRKAVDALDKALARYAGLEDTVKALEDYQASGQWLDDFEADERGELPAYLRRGVLSEDALYNLLSDIDNLRSKL